MKGNRKLIALGASLLVVGLLGFFRGELASAYATIQVLFIAFASGNVGEHFAQRSVTSSASGQVEAKP